MRQIYSKETFVEREVNSLQIEKMREIYYKGPKNSISHYQRQLRFFRFRWYGEFGFGQCTI